MRPLFKLRVPATIANVGPGYDSMGFAVGVFLTVSVIPKKGASIKTLPDDALIDAVFSTAADYSKKLPGDLVIRQDEKGIPFKRGLGSSAAARVAGVIIADKLLNLNLSSKDIALKSSELEGHPDNAVPSAMGGFALCLEAEKKLDYVFISAPQDMKVVIGIPDMEISTGEARKIIPEKIYVKDAVYSSARAALLIKALMGKDFSLLARAMQDRIHQPYRGRLIPAFDKIVRESVKAGAYGTAIAGSGPSVFSFSPESAAESVGEVMVKNWSKEGLDSRFIVTNISEKGAQLIE